MCTALSSIATLAVQAPRAIFNCTASCGSRVASAASIAIRHPIASTSYAINAVRDFTGPKIEVYAPAVIATVAWPAMTIALGTALLAGRHILDLNLIVAGTTTMGAIAIAASTAASVAIVGLGLKFGLEALFEMKTETVARDWMWLAALPIFKIAQIAAVPITTVIAVTLLGALGVFLRASTVGLFPSDSEVRSAERRAEARRSEMLAAADRCGGDDSDDESPFTRVSTHSSQRGGYGSSSSQTRDGRSIGHSSSGSQTYGGGGGGYGASSTQTRSGGGGGYGSSSSATYTRGGEGSYTSTYGKSGTATSF